MSDMHLGLAFDFKFNLISSAFAVALMAVSIIPML